MSNSSMIPRAGGLLVALAIIFGPSVEGAAQEDALDVRGKVIVEAKCAQCHATGKTGVSPFATAPPFRLLARKYPLEQLAEAFAEGITTGHPAMPEFIFTPAEIDALLAYLDQVGR